MREYKPADENLISDDVVPAHEILKKQTSLTSLMLVDDFIARTSTKEPSGNDTYGSQVVPATKPMAQWALHSQQRKKSFHLEDRHDGNEKMVGERSANDWCSCGEVEATDDVGFD